MYLLSTCTRIYNHVVAYACACLHEVFKGCMLKFVWGGLGFVGTGHLLRQDPRQVPGWKHGSGSRIHPTAQTLHLAPAPSHGYLPSGLA